MGRLLDAETAEVPVIRDALAPHKDELLDKLWAVVEKPEKGKEQQRLRAAAALAKYDPDSERWAKVQEAVWPTIWLRCLRRIWASWMESLSSGARESCSRRCRLSIEMPVGGKRSGPWRRTFSPTMPPTSRKSWPIC